MDLWSIFYQILPVLIVFVGGILLFFIKSLLQKYTKNLELEHRGAISNFVMTVVGNGIFYAEQLAKQYAKDRIQKMASGDKLNLAVNYVIEELQKNNILEFTTSEIEKRIESFLGSSTLESNLIQQDIERQNKEGNNEDFSV